MKTKKKILIIVAIVMLAMALIIPPLAFAVGSQSPAATSATATSNNGAQCNKGFVDADGDGVCDNQGTGQCAGAGMQGPGKCMQGGGGGMCAGKGQCPRMAN